MIKYSSNGCGPLLFFLKLTVFLTVLGSGCAKHPAAAPAEAKKAGKEVVLRVYAEQQPLQEAVLKALNCELGTLKDVAVTTGDNPDYFIYVSASEVKFAPPYSGPTGLSLSVLITRPADRGRLWEMRKDAPAELHKEIYKALYREQFVVQHWQRGGDLTMLEKLSKEIICDFNSEILDPDRRTEARRGE